MVEEFPALYCGGCLGVLIRNDLFGTIINVRRARRDAMPQEPVKPIDVKQYERHLDCPNCHRRMETHPYYGPGNVVIDSCGRCQYVWLDHGELARIERAAGGQEPTVSPVAIDSDGHASSVEVAAAFGIQRTSVDATFSLLADLMK